MEDIKNHYMLLKEYLGESLPSRAPSSAMARVGRLPLEQFQEVSNDLYDELNRRLHTPKDVPFLPIRNDLLPKRNQARQKMATLPENRFKDLASEIYVEIEKRFPQVIQEIGQIPKKKSVRSERNERQSRGDRERERERERRNQDSVSESSRRTDEPRRRDEDRMRSSRGRQERSRSREPAPQNRYPSFRSDDSGTRLNNDDDDLAKVRSDYEFKVAMLEKQLKEVKVGDQDTRRLEGLVARAEEANNLLQRENEDLKADLEAATRKANDIQEDFVKLQREFDVLNEDFEREQQITRELEAKVKEAKQELSMVQDDMAEKQTLIDRMRTESASLMEEVEDLKEKLRTLEADRDERPTITTKITKSPSPTFKSPLSALTSPANSVGTVKDDDGNTFKDFQKISAELLSAARKDPRPQVLGPMKSILLTCKQITQDCERMEEDPSISNSDKDSIHDTKSKLSENLTLLMQATKEHAANTGPSLAARIEKELSNLSFCVSDILELLKIIKSNSSSRDTIGRSAKRDTLRSASAAPTPAYDDNLPPMELKELKDYIEDQIDYLAHTIQDLLQAMQKKSSGEDLSALVNSISNCVDNIIYETQGTLDISPDMNQDVMADADDVVAILGDIRNELLDLGDAIIDNPTDRAMKQKIANSSYEVAKNSKELLAILK